MGVIHQHHVTIDQLPSDKHSTLCTLPLCTLSVFTLQLFADCISNVRSDVPLSSYYTLLWFVPHMDIIQLQLQATQKRLLGMYNLL